MNKINELECKIKQLNQDHNLLSKEFNSRLNDIVYQLNSVQQELGELYKNDREFQKQRVKKVLMANNKWTLEHFELPGSLVIVLQKYFENFVKI